MCKMFDSIEIKRKKIRISYKTRFTRGFMHFATLKRFFQKLRFQKPYRNIKTRVLIKYFKMMNNLFM